MYALRASTCPTCSSGHQALIAAVLFLAGCAPVVVQAPTAAKPPKTKEGTVVVSVTGNTARVSQFDSINIKQYIKSEPGIAPIKGEYILLQVSEGLARDTSLFVGAVPEGDYVFDQLSDSKTRKFIQLNEKWVERLGIFHVKAGAVSDLGRIVVTALNTRVIIGRSQQVRSNAELVKRFAPDNASIYAGEVNEGWIAPRDKSDVVEEYALQFPVGADALTELPNGWVTGASRLGTVLLRTPAGNWRGVRSDSLESLLWVKPYENDKSALIAVGEFNTMLRLDRQGHLVRIHPGNLPAGNLLFIDGSDSVGWFVAQQHGTEITLYRSVRLEAGDWRALKKESVATSFWNGANNFWAWPTKDGFAYAVSEGKIHYYDFAKETWTERSAPKNARFVRIAPQPGNTLGALTSPGAGAGGIFATDYLSRDGGATWTEIPSPFTVKLFPPYVAPSGSLLLLGGAFGSPELQESKDMGKTWRKISDKVSLEQQIVVLPTKGVFLVSTGQQFGLASIKHSEDGGATWQTEYSNFDTAAYEAQQKDKK
jgi:hypothetical protein